MKRFAALAVIDRIGARVKPAHFLKTRLGNAVNLNQKIEATIWINSSNRHVSSSVKPSAKNTKNHKGRNSLRFIVIFVDTSFF
jgi:hypothetical protein